MCELSGVSRDAECLTAEVTTVGSETRGHLVLGVGFRSFEVVVARAFGGGIPVQEAGEFMSATRGLLSSQARQVVPVIEETAELGIDSGPRDGVASHAVVKEVIS